MKRLLCSFALSLAFAAPAFSQIGISVNLGEPSFYGRIELGDAPAPRFINQEPIIIERGGEPQPPLYVHVPPGYERHWRRHCREYDACNRPVFFVTDDWYRNSYVRYYHERHGGDRDHPEGFHGRDDHNSDDHEADHRDEHRDDRDGHPDDHQERPHDDHSP